MTWSSHELTSLAGSEELHVTSSRPDGSRRPWTPIWVVRVQDDLFIRSGFGLNGAWYRNAMHDHIARIRAAGIETDVTLQPVTDSTLNSQIDEAYRSKYRTSDFLPTLITAPATESTVRLLREGA